MVKTKQRRDEMFYRAEGKDHDEFYCNCSGIAKVQHWLIKLLAGKSVVILNARITVNEREEEDIVVQVKDVNGCFFTGNGLNIPDNYQIEIGQMTVNN
jgi:hypothetical protein